ncbi:unnamed protein product [Closterium sp. Yama58-4]|nr:unnamed protein product [Closterium sp. Yama58-4]
MGAALSSMLAAPESLLILALVATVAWIVVKVLLQPKVPQIYVDTSYITEKQEESKTNRYIYFPRGEGSAGDRVQCYDPATLQYLGFSPALKASDPKSWARCGWMLALLPIFSHCLSLVSNCFSLPTHLILPRVSARESGKVLVDAGATAESVLSHCPSLISHCLVSHPCHAHLILSRVSARESGKVLVDAGFGEILTTCEKIAWLLNEGERWLKPEYRSVGRTMMHKVARVEFEPAGVIGAIVPWNYPFHNVLNPVLSAVFAGNAAVIKVSEYASWGAHYYLDIIRTALKAVGGPPELVHVITGVPPSLLRELGGKDAFIVCDDADLKQVVPIALRAVFQCSGQNCIGAERFFVQAGIYDQFVGEVVSVAQQMRLVGGQFYPPTVLVNVRSTMRILHEEVFGPIMCIVKFENDQEVVAAANDCPFGLGCSVFSGDRRRAVAIGAAVQCGMVAINDFGSTYMCQSLPFGGVKESGFGRFAGVEGLRGCCNEKAIVEDRFFSLVKTSIPPPLQYPLAPNAVPFQQALVRMFFAHTFLAQLSGLFHLLLELLRSPKRTNTQQGSSSVARGAGAASAARRNSGVAASGGERPHIE